MPMSFPSAVNAPGGASYSAPLLNFSAFGDWGSSYEQGVLSKQQEEQNKQQQQLNAQRIAEAQRQAEIAKTFQGGLPTDPNTGQIDYGKVAAMLAQKGDIGALTQMAPMIAQQQAGNTPLLPPGQGPQGGGGAPSSVAASPLPAPAANSPKGDSGQGTITSLVTDRLPSQNQTTGQTIMKIAQVMGVDPNADLTPGQQRRAQGLLQRYAPEVAGTAGGTLPPSANAVSPAPQASAPAPQPAPIGAGAPQPQGAPAQGQPPQGGAPPVQTQPQGGGPIVPQVPLPRGFTDPQQAAMALRQRAAQIESANPQTKPKADELRDWAAKIEASIAPLSVGPNTTIVDPRTGHPLYQGSAQNPLQGAALDAAAERYLQTGQFPPNTGRGVQGTQDRNAILNMASNLAEARGINQADLPAKWQDFKAQQVAKQRFTSGPQGNTIRSFNVLVDHLDTLAEAGNALKNGDMRLFNAWKQNWAAQTGNPAPTNFDGVKALVGDEIVKAVVGSAGALADREEVKKDLDRASSPKQLSELVDRYRKLALGQLKGLRKQYEVATKSKDFGDMLLPGTLAALGGNEGKGTTDAEGWTVLPNGARIREVK